MDTIFMNSENSKTSDSHRLLLNLRDKIDLRRKDKYIALSNLSIYYTTKNTKIYKNNKFKISAPTWNEEFRFSDGLKEHGEETVNPSIRIYINKIENRITFKIKAVCYLEL